MTSGDRQVEDIRRGSVAAFEELFRTFCEPLCTFARSYVHAPQVAEDLVYDVFCDIWDRRADFYPEGPVKSYLYGAVRNKALNWLAHERVHRNWTIERKHEPAEQSASPAAEAEYGELQVAVEDALQNLSPRQREVFLMTRRQGLSYAEVAEILRISRKSVENHMGRALKTLRERLSAFFTLLL